MNKLVRRYYQLKIILLTVISKVSSCFRKQSHWVLHERGKEARDNAYFLYRYLKENHPEQKVYYIIDKNSPDYHKVKEDAVHFGSFKNYWALATAERVISTHVFYGAPCMNPKLFRFCGISRKFVFLQHGIIQCDMPTLYFAQTGIPVFICGAKPEYEHIHKNFGYPDGIVQYTGLARYDTLHDAATKRQILIMPTWRKYLSSEKEFLESEYYRQWNQLLTDPKLVECLEKNDLTAVFYPHFEFQKYLHCFHSESERIVLADFARYDVQTLLKESKLLVTDYSSVFFDFAYMRKPVIYFQFDQDTFFEKHYNRGYFSYREMGFGPVVDHKTGAVDAIVQNVEQDCLPTDMYADRMNTFFPLYDQKNCERIYEAICGL